MDFVAVLQQAVSREEGALAKRALISRVLSTLGHREPPEQRRVSYEGRPETLFVWRGAPGGDLVLVGGVVHALEGLEEVGGELRKRAVKAKPARTRPRPNRVILPPAGWARVRAAIAPLKEDIDAYPIAGLEQLQPEERKLVGSLARHLVESMDPEGVTLVSDDLSAELAALRLEVELVGEGI